MATTYTRANAWNNGGTFDNPDLYWYAKGVGAMMTRALNDLSSWWFFAAIHGEYVTENGFPGWGFIPPPPSVPTSPLPPQPVQDQYWDQCQHQSWYFPPWHRGYLLALEAQIRAEISNLPNPPDTWALPYWNYLGGGIENQIPPAFMLQTLPDGSPNPLYVTARYGPNNNGNVYVPIPPVNEDCMGNDIYTGSDDVTPPPGFGGPDTGFNHGGGTSGNLESNPHNLVHVFVGGNSPDGQTWGLMSDPGIAALDPIFYLHHSNIDRLWAIWNQTLGNSNPTDASWLNGPSQQFVMPMNGSAWVFTPQQMNSLSQLNYTYEQMTLPAPAPAADRLAQRLTRLRAPAAAAKVKGGAKVTTSRNRELLGASPQPLSVKGSEANTSVKLDPGVRRKVSASLARAAETAQPDRVYLHLENVRGAKDAHVLHVYVNLPEGAKPSDHPENLAGSVGLFGLRKASLKEGKHAGQGLNFVLDITKIVDGLHLQNALDTDALRVKIVPHQSVPEQSQITVGRVSVYREGQ